MHSGFAYPTKQNFGEVSLLLFMYRQHLFDCLKAVTLKLLQLHGPIEIGPLKYEVRSSSQRTDVQCGVGVTRESSGEYLFKKLDEVNLQMVKKILVEIADRLEGAPQADYAKKFVEVVKLMKKDDPIPVKEKFESALRAYLKCNEWISEQAAERILESIDPEVFLFRYVPGEDSD
jgi:hypothetical protein